MHRRERRGRTFRILPSAFGFNLPWWDRLLGTYRSQPRVGHLAMTIGLGSFRDLKSCATVWGMLTLPFVGKIPDDAVNPR